MRLFTTGLADGRLTLSAGDPNVQPRCMARNFRPPTGVFARKSCMASCAGRRHSTGSSPGKPSGREQKPALQNLLRLGLYQIFWLDRIPDHAAVNETVELAKQNGFGSQAGFVNAVLRGYLREADETKKFWPN